MTSLLATQRDNSISAEERSRLQLEALQTSERQWAYALLRLLLGVNLFGHGATRIYHGVNNFANGMVAHMSSIVLPAPFVHSFALTVPWIELTLGTCLILAIFTRAILTAAMFFMIALTVGVTIKQDWPTAGLQLVYGFVIFALLFLRRPYATSWPEILGIDGLPTGHPDR